MSQTAKKTTTAKKTAPKARAARSWAEIRAETFTPEENAEIDQEVAKDVAEYTLALVRKHRDLTQEQLAEAAGMAQGEVSRIENAQDAMFSTIRRMIEAMGGHLEVNATFDDEKVKLRLF